MDQAIITLQAQHLTASDALRLSRGNASTFAFRCSMNNTPANQAGLSYWEAEAIRDAHKLQEINRQLAALGATA